MIMSFDEGAYVVLECRAKKCAEYVAVGTQLEHSISWKKEW
jgi:hypothetical protein